jgi:hypothetical protein
MAVAGQPRRIGAGAEACVYKPQVPCPGRAVQQGFVSRLTARARGEPALQANILRVINQRIPLYRNYFNIMEYSCPTTGPAVTAVIAPGNNCALLGIGQAVPGAPATQLDNIVLPEYTADLNSFNMNPGIRGLKIIRYFLDLFRILGLLGAGFIHLDLHQHNIGVQAVDMRARPEDIHPVYDPRKFIITDFGMATVIDDDDAEDDSLTQLGSHIKRIRPLLPPAAPIDAREERRLLQLEPDEDAFIFWITSPRQRNKHMYQYIVQMIERLQGAPGGLNAYRRECLCKCMNQLNLMGGIRGLVENPRDGGADIGQLSSIHTSQIRAYLHALSGIFQNAVLTGPNPNLRIYDLAVRHLLTTAGYERIGGSTAIPPVPLPYYGGRRTKQIKYHRKTHRRQHDNTTHRKTHRRSYARRSVVTASR